ncbi:MAG TPA: phosphatidylinositol mannoside acyltransferase [Actinomycetota bacterium]
MSDERAERPVRETPKETIAFWGYRGLAGVARSLPEGLGVRTFETMGRAAYGLLPGVRATVTANQARVLGVEVSDPRAAAAAREAFALYGRYWYDTFRASKRTTQELNARTVMLGLEHVDRALEAGRGCICVLPHTGNWDIGGYWFAANGYRLVAVAEELRPPRLFELFLRHREERGMRILPLTKSAHVGTQLKQLLSENWMVALVADRDLTGRGIEVEMFGAPRRIPAGPALLSITTGAPILPCPTTTLRDGWQIRFEAPLELERSGELKADVAALTRLMAERFERAIAANPTDWHMFQPGWEPASAPARRTRAAPVTPVT